MFSRPLAPSRSAIANLDDFRNFAAQRGIGLHHQDPKSLPRAIFTRPLLVKAIDRQMRIPRPQLVRQQQVRRAQTPRASGAATANTHRSADQGQRQADLPHQRRGVEHLRQVHLLDLLERVATGLGQHLGLNSAACSGRSDSSTAVSRLS